METVTTILLWFCALGCGLLGGIYFAFSAFIMTALDRAGVAHGVAAMNAINVKIVRSAFMPLFLATTFASAALVIIGSSARSPLGTLMLTGGATYLLGMFGVTMIWNVPLNNALAAAEGTPDAGAAWANYRRSWTRWNHLRTLASTAAAALFIAALQVVPR
jgi:uncharacterized membrane protein